MQFDEKVLERLEHIVALLRHFRAGAVDDPAKFQAALKRDLQAFYAWLKVELEPEQDKPELGYGSEELPAQQFDAEEVLDVAARIYCAALHGPNFRPEPEDCVNAACSLIDLSAQAAATARRAADPAGAQVDLPGQDQE